MTRPTRDTLAGRTYLDLQNQARATGRPTEELLVLYALEGLLDRLSVSPHADDLVVMGGVLLAAYDARRPPATLTCPPRTYRTTPPPSSN